MKFPYNPKDKNSIIEYAKLLKGKTLRESCDSSVLQHKYSGKGNFGQVLEKFYFGYEPNSLAEADFAQIGMELKSSPLKLLKNKQYRSKERLVLNIINYIKVVEQKFEESDFIKKNASILLIFYLHESGVDILDLMIKLVDEWNIPPTDLEIIKQDWERINQKILEGKAHELSEGDTFYLGACTKGANATSTRLQPFSNIPAKQRAYSFKQGYVNHIIASIANEPSEIYGRLIQSVDIARGKGIEEFVIDKFELFYGKSVEQIILETGIEINQKAKSFYYNLTKSILGISLDKKIEEFEKADIIIKAVRVEHDDKIIESISFKKFDFKQLTEENWEDSEFKNILEQKFLFIFFKDIKGIRVLHKAKFWNMPYNDILEARKVWEHTKNIISTGNIVNEIMPNGTRKTNFLGKKDNKVSHVRPHAKNAKDTTALPVQDILTQENEYTKHCFWLNNDYIKNNIYLKD